MPKSAPLWEKQPWESAQAFRAFHTCYLAQDPPRSLEAAYRAYRLNGGCAEVDRLKAPGTWQNWARGQNHRGALIAGSSSWAERGQAWEDHLAALDREKWEQRRKQIREDDWEAGQLLRKRAREILEDPEAFRKYTFTTTATGATHEKTELLTGAAITATELASKLERLAAEMETDRTKLEHAGQVFLSSQWIELRTTILAALESYPQARLALAEALDHERNGNG